MTKSKRILTILLLLLLLPSCGTKDTGEEQRYETESIAETTAETEHPYRDTIPDGLDFDGYTFVTACAIGQNDAKDSNGWGFLTYFDTDGMTGEVLNDSAYIRNCEIEERFNVLLECEELGTNAGTVIAEIIHMSFLAGDNICDIANVQRCDNYYNPDTLHSIMDIKSLPYVDLSREYYNQKSQQVFTLKDRLYFLIGDYTVPTHPYQRITFNYDMWTDYQLEDPYELVKSGKWTFDKMISVTEGIYQDLNGNDRKDENDKLGLVTRYDWYGFCYAAGGVNLIQSTGDGYMLTVATEQNVDILTKLVKAMDEPDVGVYDLGIFIQPNFNDGNVLMYMGGSGMAEIREIDNFHVSILPYPKLSEDQEEYMMRDEGGMIAVPSLTENPERTGAILEALYAASTDTLKEAFIESYVQMKVLRDEGAQDMFRIIIDSLVYDFAQYIGKATKLSYNWFITDLIAAKSTDLVSSWEQIRESTEKVYDDYFAGLED